jgi:hypothetical protein
MFIGHYGPAFGAKAALTQIPLLILFVAVQWLDVVWSILVMAGIEKARIMPEPMAGNALDLYDMPYTHGLLGAILLSAFFGGAVALCMRADNLAVFGIVSCCAFSHWVLDFLVHRPDLWIFGDVKVGLGLWRWVWVSLPLELALLLAGAWLYERFVPARGYGNAMLWIFVACMAGLELYATFGPAPVSPIAEAQTALVAYIALAMLAGLVDLTRRRGQIPRASVQALNAKRPAEEPADGS